MLFLGNENQHAQYLEDTNAGRIFGVFGLTELGHGTNVRFLETTAQYIHETDEFIINSPTWQSQKFWPGGISRDGMFATIFARLIYNENDHGIHAFIVQLRSRPCGETSEGVKTYEIPRKTCYNGVDNGGLLFHNVRIPRASYLNKLSSIEKFSNLSDILSVFLPGRVGIIAMGIGQTKLAISIAIRHCSIRKQFSQDNSMEPEVPILKHPLVKRKICSTLAKLILSILGLQFFENLFNQNTLDKKFLHVIASGYKSICSWDMRDSLIICRELMGGQGFILKNRVGELISHIDLVTTGEGDNTMLMKQVVLKILRPIWIEKYAKLLDHSHQYSTFQEHVKHLKILQHLADRMREELIIRVQGDHPGVDYNLDFGIQIGELYVRMFLIDAALSIASNCSQISDQAMNIILGFIRIYTLITLLKFQGPLLSYGFLNGNEVRIVGSHFDNLCKELSDFALTIVDSFGIPNEIFPKSNLFGGNFLSNL